jgi:hypothetical protein
MKSKERGSTQFKINLTHSIGDGIRPILEWDELSMGSYEVVFLQMQPCLISHLKHLWYLMLIMVLFVLSVGFLQNVLNLLLDVLN